MIPAQMAPGVKTEGGRPSCTSREEIAGVAFELFARQGFARTTVDEIAREVGVGRRTIFRYFPSKNDMVWGDFDRATERMREQLAAAAPQQPMMAALRQAAIASNRVAANEEAGLRMRMTLVVRNPPLQGHLMVRYAAWRRVVAEFAAERLGCRHDELLPQAVAHAALGTSIAAFTRWVRSGDEDLERCLDDAFAALANGFSERDNPHR
jgi:mycofactocin system transcriptional regulator